MKKILVVNPNTSKEMTNDIRETINKVKDKNISVDVVCTDFGPESLESFYDYTLAGFGVIKLLNNMKTEYDGVLISCFGDPCLYAIKEMMDCPVIGIAEASITSSLLMGQKFSLLVALDKAVPLMKDMVNQYSLSGRLASILPINMSVLDVERNKEESVKRLISLSRKAIEDGAEVIILGCAGMTRMKEEIEMQINVPVIDPVEMGYKVLELFVGNNINISKVGLYKKPIKKKIKNEGILKY